MNSEAKEILERLGRPLLIWRNTLLFSLKSSGAQDDSSNHPYRPDPSTHSMLTSYPLTPALLILAGLLLVGSMTPARQWASLEASLPILARIFSASQEPQSAPIPNANENVAVWVNKQSGLYYCRGGILYGSKPGELMTQGAALTSGYRPADGEVCNVDGATQPPSYSLSVRARIWLQSFVSMFPDTNELLAKIWNKQAGMTKPEEGISVWANTQSGLYYCQGGLLFGAQPGQLMKQADAVKSGYRPADQQYCAEMKPNDTPADILPSQASAIDK
jgi:hypothetical protein